MGEGGFVDACGSEAKSGGLVVVPWRALVDPTLFRRDLIVLALVLRKRSILVSDLLDSLGWGQGLLVSVCRLLSAGYIVESQTEAGARLSVPLVVRYLTPSSVPCLRLTKQVVAAKLANDPFSPVGVLGLFRQLYFQKYRIEYAPSVSLACDLRELEILGRRLGDPKLLRRCVQVYFSKDMDWVKHKRLDFFFDFIRVQKHVLPLAVVARDEESKRPEWSASTVATPSVFIPKGLQ
jgi:hypothetical protein